jgi:hypothetical protein
MIRKVLLFGGLASLGYYAYRVTRLKVALDDLRKQMPTVAAAATQSTLVEAAQSQASYALIGAGALLAWKVF